MNSNNPQILELIQNYKSYIHKSKMQDEVYKWKLLNQFKGRPDTNAPDFAAEYKAVKYGNLMYQLSGAVGNHICKENPEAFRQLFVYLFDESKPLEDRLVYFNEESLKLYRSIGGEKGHHQDERTISAYLTVHNPEKYTFYKSGFYLEFCKLIGATPAGKNKKYVHYLELLKTFIHDFIEQDQELIEMVKGYIPEYYDGTNHLLLAQDILYCILNNRHLAEPQYWRIGTTDDADDYWKLMKSDNLICIGWPNLGDLNEAEITSKKDIDSLLKLKGSYISDNRVRSKKSLEIFNFCKTAREGDIVLAQTGHTVLGIGIIRDDYNYNPNAGFPHQREVEWIKTFTQGEFKNDEGSQTTFVPLLGTELINKIKSYLSGDTTIISTEINISMNNPINQILYGPPGTGKTYTLKSKYFPSYTTKETALTKDKHFEEVVRELTWWQVIALALLEIGTNKVNEILTNRWVSLKASLSESKNVRATIWGTLQMHTIQESTTVSYTQRQSPLIFDKKVDKTWEIIEVEVKESCPELYDILNSVNNFNPNPDKEIKRYVFTTFHQSFNYEDFIEGIKPVLADEEGNGDVSYRIEDGIFKDLCKRAESDPENRYAIFIDEINRGNVSAIFGELITLIETDKRKGAEHSMNATLPYSKKQFTVPSNVDIYGTMNTADRSVEALDTALRRRFSFTEMLPQPELIKTEGPLKSSQGIINGIDLSVLLTTINKRIEKLLDKDHQIGHSYFLKVDTLESLKSAFHTSIIPLLQEYFFGDYGKIGLVLGQGFFVEMEPSEDEKFFAEFKDYEIDGILDKRIYHLRDVTQLDDNSFIEIVKAILPRK